MNWLLLFCMASITFFNRYLFFSSSVKYLPGPKVRRFLSYSSFSVLTAIWAPIMFRFDGHTQIEVAGVDYLFAGSLAAVLSVCKVSSIIVVLLSTTVFFIIRFLL